MKKRSVILLFSALTVWFGSGCSDDHTELIHVSAIELDGGAGDAANAVTVTRYKTVQVAVRTLPAEALDRGEYTAYDFESSDTNIFTVSEQGVVEGIGIGSAFLRITSRYNPEIQLTASVQVEPQPAESIVLDYHGTDEFLLEVGGTFAIGSFFEVLPQETHDKSLTFRSDNTEIVSVDGNGLLTGVAPGTVKVTVSSASTPTVTTRVTARVVVPTGFEPLDRSAWTIETSHNPTSEGTWESMLDDKTNTFMALVKPGKSYSGITVPSTDVVYFIVDMQQPQEFSGFTIGHRNTYTYLRVHEVSVYASDDGTNFVPLQLHVPVPHEPQSQLSARLSLPAKFKYRYFKMTYDQWGGSGSTMQITEFNIGTVAYE